MLESEAESAKRSCGNASRKLVFEEGGESNEDAEDEKHAVMKETLAHIEKNFKKDLQQLKSLVSSIKEVEVKTQMRAHLKQNIQSMCVVYLNHYNSIWRDVLDMPGEQSDVEGPTTSQPDSVAEAILQMYFHLERCEQCVDGSERYMEKLPDLVNECQTVKSYVFQCLDIALKSKEVEEEGGLGRYNPTAKDRVYARRTHAGSFKDEFILEHLYQENFFQFVTELKTQIVKDFNAVQSFTKDHRQGLLYKHDCLQVISNTLEELVPPFLDFLTGKQQFLSGKRRTIMNQVANALYYSPSKSQSHRYQ